jgi:hypothetical protein
MPRQRVLSFTVKGRNRSSKLAPNDERERATVLVCHLAGNVSFETISDLGEIGVKGIGRD